MDCAVRNSKYHKNNNRCALCPLCRGPYTIVTQIDNNLKYNISGKFKVPDFPWVSAFCMGLANNLRMRVTDEKIDMSMPEYLNEMIGCTSTVYWVVGENETMSEVLNGTMSKEMENRFVAIGKALTAWVLLPDIYPKLVAAKHLERMVKDGLIIKKSTASICQGYDGVGRFPVAWKHGRWGFRVHHRGCRLDNNVA
jgi:hypothetical protein